MAEEFLKAFIGRHFQHVLKMLVKVVDGLGLLAALQADTGSVVHHQESQDCSDGKLDGGEAEAEQAGRRECADHGRMGARHPAVTQKTIKNQFPVLD